MTGTASHCLCLCTDLSAVLLHCLLLPNRSRMEGWEQSGRERGWGGEEKREGERSREGERGVERGREGEREE